jgi:REP element-mobilizing transposase RayT
MAGRGRHPERRPTRRPGWDYTSPGAYYVTINVEGRFHLFGRIVDGVMDRSPAGETIARAWELNAARSPEILLDAFIVMPDHLHGVLIIRRRGGKGLIRAVQSFKSITDRTYTRGAEHGIFPMLNGRLWQRSFHDHIVRDAADLARIRRYIESNPARWEASRRAEDDRSTVVGEELASSP